jgi:hypothetical protein
MAPALADTRSAEAEKPRSAVAPNGDRSRDEDYRDDDSDEHRARPVNSVEIRAATAVATPESDDRGNAQVNSEDSETAAAIDRSAAASQLRAVAPPSAPVLGTAIATADRAQPAELPMQRVELPPAPAFVDKLVVAGGAQRNTDDLDKTDHRDDELVVVATPIVGEISIDVKLIEQGVKAFFSHLTELNAAQRHASLGVGLTSWMAVTAVVALEIARARDRLRRSVLPGIAHSILAPQTAGEQP